MRSEGSVCTKATLQAGKARTWASVAHEKEMQTGLPGCGGCRKERRIENETDNRQQEEEKMKKVWIGLLIIALTAGFAFAQSEGTVKDAQAMLAKAVAFYKANGQAKAFAAFDDTKGKFVDRDIYIYVSDMNAKVISHGANPALIGKTLIDLKDSDGKQFMKELVDKAKASPSGSIDYKWTKPSTKKVETKTVFYQKVGDVIIACGAYK